MSFLASLSDYSCYYFVISPFLLLKGFVVGLVFDLVAFLTSFGGSFCCFFKNILPLLLFRDLLLDLVLIL